MKSHSSCQVSIIGSFFSFVCNLWWNNIQAPIWNCSQLCWETSRHLNLRPFLYLMCQQSSSYFNIFRNVFANETPRMNSQLLLSWQVSIISFIHDCNLWWNNIQAPIWNCSQLCWETSRHLNLRPFFYSICQWSFSSFDIFRDALRRFIIEAH